MMTETSAADPFGGWAGPRRTMMDKKRLQFDFSERALEQLDKLVELTDAASRAEVVRRALQVYNRLVQAEANGAEVLLQGKDGQVQKLIA
jgi:hypothetical protein